MDCLGKVLCPPHFFVFFSFFLIYFSKWQYIRIGHQLSWTLFFLCHFALAYQKKIPIFNLFFVFFKEIVQKCVKYSKKFPKKKEDFFNKTQIKYEFLTLKHIKIHIKYILLKNSFF